MGELSAPIAALQLHILNFRTLGNCLTNFFLACGETQPQHSTWWGYATVKPPHKQLHAMKERTWEQGRMRRKVRGNQREGSWGSLWFWAIHPPTPLSASCSHPLRLCVCPCFFLLFSHMVIIHRSTQVSVEARPPQFHEAENCPQGLEEKVSASSVSCQAMHHWPQYGTQRTFGTVCVYPCNHKPKKTFSKLGNCFATGQGF